MKKLIYLMLLLLIAGCTCRRDVREVDFSIRGNNISNYTSYDIDEMLYDYIEELDLRDIDIKIVYMPRNYGDGGDIVYYGVVEKMVWGNEYIIYLKKHMYYGEYREVLAHEMIHIQQYYIGDLVKLNTYYYLYKGELIDMREVAYMDRKFEIDAIERIKYMY